MCNACGFMCCGYDGFSGCGCDHCANPDCWDPDDNDFTCDSDDDWDDDWDDYDAEPPMPDPATLTAAQRQMVLDSGPDAMTGKEGCGVELRTGAHYAIAKALGRRGLGYHEGPGGSYCGLYFNNGRGLRMRSSLKGDR